MSSGLRHRLQQPKEGASEVALEAADRLASALAFTEATFDVGHRRARAACAG
jgi:hypothetical protein